MTLADMASQGRLERLNPHREEVNTLLRTAARRLEDAANPTILPRHGLNRHTRPFRHALWPHFARRDTAPAVGLDDISEFLKHRGLPSRWKIHVSITTRPCVP